MADDNEKKVIIEEIQRRIEYLIHTDEISDTEKVVIARNVLNLIENGEREKKEGIQ